MTEKALENLVRIGQLRREAPDNDEFQGLLRSATVRLKDASSTALSPESRFDLAYNAAHALAALRWHGYRSTNRYQVFQCLTHTLGLRSEQWRVLDQAHRKRNAGEYEGILEIDENLLESLIRVAGSVREAVERLEPPDG